MGISLKTAEVPYDQVEWVWISNHYDIHLDGLCRFEGELSRFETWESDSDNPVCRIFRLSALQKVSWLLQKKLFEICIGRHWTYPDRKQGARFHMGGWSGKALFTAYYACKKTIRRVIEGA